MNVKEVREIIKTNNFNVKIMARTNGLIKATSFDLDDLNDLNEVLKNYGYTFKVEFAGTKFERFPLQQTGTN